MNVKHSSQETSARPVGADSDLFVVTAATSDTGSAVVRALLEGGSDVVAVGRDRERLRPYAGLGARTHVSALDDGEGSPRPWKGRAARSS
ncbi:hypothetical protein F8R89_00450 [Streptomyces sp. SS1-1]|uniref:hypothetical protein n=1 Tax=Streptomyces sp. SS1-1 TaxID=2651869 RepID=UPI00124F7D77|nr:hypothetical protein [Streptomyces sp. SS1-1]KAB2977573.1 hypothetical protein F8R89_00450 [Streptomyces sp. SS1-1]